MSIRWQSSLLAGPHTLLVRGAGTQNHVNADCAEILVGGLSSSSMVQKQAPGASKLRLSLKGEGAADGKKEKRTRIIEEPTDEFEDEVSDEEEASGSDDERDTDEEIETQGSGPSKKTSSKSLG